MFTGIIEQVGSLKKIEKEKENIHFWIQTKFINELKIDQSVAHNGVCLTVVDFKDDLYKVTIIQESLKRSNLGNLKMDDLVNLERCMQMNGRLDGHIVQGHVDEIGTIKSIENQDGSFLITIEYDENSKNLTVEKGSICINGISLTVVDSEKHIFSVAIIPYTWEHTNLHRLQVGDTVNLEFDIVGKYISKMIQNQTIKQS